MRAAGSYLESYFLRTGMISLLQTELARCCSLMHTNYASYDVLYCLELYPYSLCSWFHIYARGKDVGDVGYDTTCPGATYYAYMSD